MKNKKVSKRVKRRLLISTPITIIIVAFTIFTAFTYISKIKVLMDKEKELSTQLNELETNENDLSKEISKLKDPDYIAKYARENYFYSKNGEYVIKTEPKKVEETEKKSCPFNYWFVIVPSGTILIFGIYILIKKRKK